MHQNNISSMTTPLATILSAIKSNDTSNILSLIDDLQSTIPDIYRLTMLMTIFHKNKDIGMILFPYINLTTDKMTNIIIDVAILFHQYYVIELVPDNLSCSQIYHISKQGNIDLIKQIILNSTPFNQEYIFNIISSIEDNKIEIIVPYLMNNVSNQDYMILINVVEMLFNDDHISYYGSVLADYMFGVVDNSIIALNAYVTNNEKLFNKSLLYGEDIQKFIDLITTYDQYNLGIFNYTKYNMLNSIVAEGHKLNNTCIQNITTYYDIKLMDLLGLIVDSIETGTTNINLTKIGRNIIQEPSITYDIMNYIAQIFVYDIDSYIILPKNINILNWLLDNNYDFNNNSIFEIIDYECLDWVVKNNIKCNTWIRQLLAIDYRCFDKLCEIFNLKQSDQENNLSLTDEQECLAYYIYYGLIYDIFVNNKDVMYIYDRLWILNNVKQISYGYLVDILAMCPVHHNDGYKKILNEIISKFFPDILTVKLYQCIYMHTPIKMCDITPSISKSMIEIAKLNDNMQVIELLYENKYVLYYSHIRYLFDRDRVNNFIKCNITNMNLKYNDRYRLFIDLARMHEFDETFVDIVDTYYCNRISEFETLVNFNWI